MILKHEPAGLELAVNVGWDVSVGLPSDRFRALIQGCELLADYQASEPRQSFWQRLFGKRDND
jgi:hypothetical protein